MSFDSTMKFATNLTREEIEAKFRQLASIAETGQMGEVARLLSGTDGLPRAELGSRINQCLQLLGGSDEYAFLVDQLDMLSLNLPNIE